MKNFIVYLANGDIQRTGSCADADLELQAGANEFVIEGEANDATQMMVKGKVATKPPKPPKPFSITEARSIKTNQTSADCEAFITAGFTSNALGTTNTYPSHRDDQLNLMGAVQRSMMTGVLLTDSFVYACKGANGKWAYVSHNAIQIQQVGKDSYTHLLNSRLKNSTLQTRIDTAKTQAELDAINW